MLRNSMALRSRVPGVGRPAAGHGTPPRNETSRCGRDGFTLFEAVVSLMIIGLVAVSTLSALSAQLRAQERAQRASVVDALAQDRLLALQLLTADEMQVLPDTLAPGVFPPPLQQYSWRIVSRAVPGEDYLHDVAISVNWLGGSHMIYSRVYRAPEPMPFRGAR